MVQPVGLGVFGDVAADQPDLAVLDPPVGLGQQRPCRRGDSSPRCRPHDAALERIEHVVVVACLRFWAISRSFGSAPFDEAFFRCFSDVAWLLHSPRGDRRLIRAVAGGESSRRGVRSSQPMATGVASKCDAPVNLFLGESSRKGPGPPGLPPPRISWIIPLLPSCRARLKCSMSSMSFETEQRSPAVEPICSARSTIAVPGAATAADRPDRRPRRRADRPVALRAPPVVTIGRAGSSAEIAGEAGWCGAARSRSSGSIGAAGACCIAPASWPSNPLVPLRWHGFSVGEYLDRLHAALVETLEEPAAAAISCRSGLCVGTHRPTGRRGRRRRGWVPFYRAWLNVGPPMGLFRLVDADPVGGTRMSSWWPNGAGP